MTIMELIVILFFMFLVCLGLASCGYITLTSVAKIELKMRGYHFEEGWKPRPPNSVVRCKAWPEFGAHAEYCEVIK